MQLPAKTPDWLRPVLIALIIPTLGALWILLRPGLSAIVWHLIEHSPERKAKMFFDVFGSKEHQPRLKEIAETIFAERMDRVDTELGEALEGLTSANHAVARLDASQQRQGLTINEILNATRDLPQLNAMVGRLALSVESIATDVSKTAVLTARMDERQQAMKQIIDRRQEQVAPHPTRRADDYESPR